jgi:beta-glucosidase
LIGSLRLRRLSPVILACALFFPVRTTAQERSDSSDSKPAYLNPQLPMERRVDDLVSRMTLEEKASQLVNQSRAIPRLQVPAYDWWSEGLHGVARAGVATVFPQAIALAATWDTPLMHDLAGVISTEARVKHDEAIRQGRRDIYEGLTFWSPNINIFRDPRWGRGQETYGEDPFLTARMGVAFVTGLQGDDPKYLRVVSTPKHFAVHSGPESTRHAADVRVSLHDMEDTYLAAFRATVTEGKADSVMCAYNSINGAPACANAFLLQRVLRGAWKFDGYVVSDCGAISDIAGGHHFAKTMAEAAAVSLKNGTDNACADYRTKVTDDSDYVMYLNAVKQGLLGEKDVDVAVKRLLRARFQLGMFDPPELVKYAQIPWNENDSEAHRALALESARETMVLLKNDGVLPLKATTKKIAVVGPLADSIRVLEGNYNGTPSRATTALRGIRKEFAGAEVMFAPGTEFLHDGEPVPGSALATDDGQPGLKGEYFEGTELQGTPVTIRVDKDVDFEFTGDSPAPRVGRQGFSVRWTGMLTAPATGAYRLGAAGGDGFRLWLDGKLIVNEWRNQGPNSKSAKVTLEKGQKYSLKLECSQGAGLAMAKLLWWQPGDDPLKEAMAAAKEADVVIAVVGITSDLEGEEMDVQVPGFKGGDRTSLDLPQPEQAVLEAVEATGKPLVVVLMNGSALSVNWAQEHANAILDAWYPGEEGGTAIAETLAGVSNPAGRLPVTFYKGVDQLPSFEDYAMKGRTYRYFTGEPLYAFGYGLSYSTFRYSELQLGAAEISTHDSLKVQATIENTSSLSGDEVAELYVSYASASTLNPLRSLQGFERVHLKAGERRQVEFILTPRQLSTVDAEGKRLVEPGSYSIWVGGQQPDSAGFAAQQGRGVEAMVTVTGQPAELPE